VASPAVIRELDRADFLAELDALVAIYAAAMNPHPAEMLGRRHIMRRHAGNPGFRALAASDSPAGQAVAFAYGFRGAAGQWWHDVVVSALTAAGGHRRADSWMSDVLEIAEVHVHPDHQRHGIGRSMLLTLTSGRTERTAVLSTMDAESAARRLYRGLGFVDLLTGYNFPGGGPLYAVMGTALPLGYPPMPGPPSPDDPSSLDDPPSPAGPPSPGRR
jgi:ribosomal protein S18 acetylase RimI-like enzyme